MKRTFAIKTGAAGAIFFILFVLAAIFGWFANIYKFFGMLGGEVTALFVARIVGIFAAPLGVVLGYF